jgi:hypothetical protein
MPIWGNVNTPDRVFAFLTERMICKHKSQGVSRQLRRHANGAHITGKGEPWLTSILEYTVQDLCKGASHKWIMSQSKTGPIAAVIQSPHDAVMVTFWYTPRDEQITWGLGVPISPIGEFDLRVTVTLSSWGTTWNPTREVAIYLELWTCELCVDCSGASAWSK